MRKRSIGYSFLCGALVFVAVLLLLIQLFGVPFWWAFGVGNTQDGPWWVSVLPENPTVGENVMVLVVFNGNSSAFPVVNATVTVTRSGMQPIAIHTNETGEASFAYHGDGTIIRASAWRRNSVNNSTKQAIHSLYVAIPNAPPTWVKNCWIAVSGAIVSGLFAGIATFILQRKSWTKLSLTHNLVAKSHFLLYFSCFKTKPFQHYCMSI